MDGKTYYISGEPMKKGNSIYVKENKAFLARSLNHLIKGFADNDCGEGEVVGIVAPAKIKEFA